MSTITTTRRPVKPSFTILFTGTPIPVPSFGSGLPEADLSDSERLEVSRRVQAARKAVYASQPAGLDPTWGQLDDAKEAARNEAEQEIFERRVFTNGYNAGRRGITLDRCNLKNLTGTLYVSYLDGHTKGAVERDRAVRARRLEEQAELDARYDAMYADRVAAGEIVEAQYGYE